MAPRQPWTLRLPTDGAIMEVAHLSEFELARMRRELYRAYAALSWSERFRTDKGGDAARFARLDEILRTHIAPESRLSWYTFLGYTEPDVDEMCRDEYPIDRVTVQFMSALFGITTAYLLLAGRAPEPVTDPVTLGIDLFPWTGERG